MLVGADVECVNDDFNTAEVKLHDSEKEKEPELYGAPSNVASEFWGLWAMLSVIGFTWVELRVLLIRPIERLLQLLWEAEAILMVVLLLRA